MPVITMPKFERIKLPPMPKIKATIVTPRPVPGTTFPPLQPVMDALTVAARGLTAAMEQFVAAWTVSVERQRQQRQRRPDAARRFYDAWHEAAERDHHGRGQR